MEGKYERQSLFILSLNMAVVTEALSHVHLYVQEYQTSLSSGAQLTVLF